MGEYARRISDGQKVKIGTCEEMFACRYEQLNEIEYEYRTDGLLWRIPMPEEDGIKPGDFEYPIVRKNYIPWDLQIKEQYLSDKAVKFLTEHPGNRQLWDEKDGLLVNLRCYHGLSLPKSAEGMWAHWNGKSNPLYLAYIGNEEKEMEITVECRVCRKSWSFSFNEIAPAICSLWMKLRLWHICTEYWYSRVEKDYDAKPHDIDIEGMGKRLYRLTTNEQGTFRLLRFNKNDNCWTIEKEGSWPEVRTKLLQVLPYNISTSSMKERYLKGNDGV